MPRSSSSYLQFGSSDDGVAKPVTPDVEAPTAYGSATRDTSSQQTAWKTRDMGKGRPLPYSKKSAGSTYRWDDDSSGSTMPRA